MNLRGEKGVVLGMVFLFTAMCSLLVAYSLQQGFQHASLTTQVSRERTQNYYHAQAGVVNAYWRIRVNFTGDIGGGSFLNATFNPAPYFIDIDTDTVHMTQTATDDIRVDIGPANPGTFLRPITSTGLNP
jgi:hypothetical protein